MAYIGVGLLSEGDLGGLFSGGLIFGGLIIGSYDSFNSEFEYRIKFQFEVCIVHFKSDLLKQ